MATDEVAGILAGARNLGGHWSAEATVSGGKGEKRRWRDHNRSPKMTVGSGCSPPYGVAPPTAKSPEEVAQKCAAGRDAVQIARLQEVVSKSRITAHPVPQH